MHSWAHLLNIDNHGISVIREASFDCVIEWALINRD